MIPDEAVEAAAMAWCGSTDLRDWQRRHIRKLLEAAAPHIMAAAWDEGQVSMATDFLKPLDDIGRRSSSPNPYRISNG